MSLKGCDPSDLSESVEGINSRLKEQLQCRKKAYPGQTEAERWQQMYQLIFPEDKNLPSPCEFFLSHTPNLETNTKPFRL
jgi:hypothetical protein